MKTNFFFFVLFLLLLNISEEIDGVYEKKKKNIRKFIQSMGGKRGRGLQLNSYVQFPLYVKGAVAWHVCHGASKLFTF